MQAENNNAVLLVVYLFFTYVHIAMGTLQPEIADDFLRHRRSVLTDAGYGSRLQAGSNVARSSNILRSIYGKFGPGKRSVPFSEEIEDDREEIEDDRLGDLSRIKRILSDYGYGSRLQAGQNVAYSNYREGLFGTSGPGKRSVEMNDIDMLYDNAMKYKRFTTDYGYGSRLQAGRNLAKSWGRNELFGTMGPGKRSIPDKRIVIDLGYGSRSQAAENAAKSSSEDLFGIYGPGKRNSGMVSISDIWRV